MRSVARYSLLNLIIITVFLLNCNCDGTNGPDPDTKRPTVVSVTPLDGAEQVPLDAVITATFSEKLDASTVTNLSVSIIGVAGTVSYSDPTATFTPDSALDSATTYLARVTTAVTNVAGNPLAAVFSWSFKTVLDSSTADLIPPEAAITNPADSTVLSDTVTIEVSATDNTEVARVEFLIDGSHVLSADDLTAPYEYLWDLSLLETGSQHTLQAVAYDTAGNSGTSAPVTVYYLWRLSPVVSAPTDGAVVGDSVNVQVLPPTTIYSIELAQFFVDDVHIVSADDITPPFEFTWDATGWGIGSVHTIYALLSDSAGNILSSDTVTVHYLWQLLIADGDENPQARDIRNVYARSSDSTLEFRVETNGSWGANYRDTSGIDLVFFIDADQDPQTGRKTASDRPINDIGAEYRAIIGSHGDNLSVWNTGFDTWQELHEATGFAYRNIQPDTNIFEIGIYRVQVGDPVFSIDIVTTNVQLISPDTSTWRWDWAPDNGHAIYDMSAPGLFIAPPANSRQSWHDGAGVVRFDNPYQ